MTIPNWQIRVLVNQYFSVLLFLAEKSQNEVLLAYEEERKKYMDRKIKKNKSTREKETLAILAKFQSKLSATR